MKKVREKWDREMGEDSALGKLDLPIEEAKEDRRKRNLGEPQMDRTTDRIRTASWGREGYGLLIRFGLELALLVASVVLSIRQGVLAGFHCVLIILLINLFPMRERWSLHNGSVSAKSIQWRFHHSWLAFWLSIIFGAWSLFPPHTWIFLPSIAWHLLWILLFFPVFFIEAMISYIVPIMSIRLMTLRFADDRKYRFFVLGTWWGDELSIRSEHPDRLEFELGCEVGKVHVALRPGTEYDRYTRTFDDNTFLGVFPRIERVELECCQPARQKDQAVNSVTG